MILEKEAKQRAKFEDFVAFLERQEKVAYDPLLGNLHDSAFSRRPKNIQTCRSQMVSSNQINTFFISPLFYQVSPIETIISFTKEPWPRDQIK